MVTFSLTDAEIYRVAEKLPTAPRLLVELGQLLNNAQVEESEVVALLRQDPAMVAHIVRIANSAAYAPRERIGSLERALGHVGFAEVHRLVGAVAACQLADQPMRLYPVDGAKLRLHTLYVAVLMEELAKWSGERPNSCYTVGLLRTIGMMALERMAPADAVIPTFAESGETALDAWEQKYWGITNGEIAEKLLLNWRLPLESVAAIRHHYRPAGRHNPIVHLLTLAAGAASARYYGIPGESVYWDLTHENFSKSGIHPDDFKKACAKAEQKYARLKIAIA